MATGGIDEREERARRRDLVRMAEETKLKDQGVVFSDPEELYEQGPHSPEEGDEHAWDTGDENWSLALSDSDGESKEKEDSHKRYKEIEERTNLVQEENLKIEERMKVLERREQLTVQQEKGFAQRKEHFQRQMKLNEDNIRKAMKKQIQEEMYVDSLKILKNLETDLIERQRIAIDKEREIAIREETFKITEERWKAQEAEMERTYRDKIKQEVEIEMLSRAAIIEQSSRDTDVRLELPVKVECEGYRTAHTGADLNERVASQETGGISPKVKTDTEIDGVRYKTVPSTLQWSLEPQERESETNAKVNKTGIKQ